MTDPTVLDLRRELEKARLPLIDTQTYLVHHAEANAALHCSTTVLHSPLHAKVTAAIQQIEHALLRTENAVTASVSDDDKGLAAVLLDLDRCMHGRHALDNCGSCQGGHSNGNHHMPVGTVVGYDRYGDPITVPKPADRHSPKAWRRSKEDY